jgi:hypothetical protein
METKEQEKEQFVLRCLPENVGSLYDGWHAARDELNLVVLLGSVTTRQVAGQVSLTPILPVVLNRDDSKFLVFGIMRFLVAPTLNLAFALKGHPLRSSK